MSRNSMCRQAPVLGALLLFASLIPSLAAQSTVDIRVRHSHQLAQDRDPNAPSGPGTPSFIPSEIVHVEISGGTDYAFASLQVFVGPDLGIPGGVPVGFADPRGIAGNLRVNPLEWLPLIPTSVSRAVSPSPLTDPLFAPPIILDGSGQACMTLRIPTGFFGGAARVPGANFVIQALTTNPEWTPLSAPTVPQLILSTGGDFQIVSPSQPQISGVSVLDAMGAAETIPSIIRGTSETVEISFAENGGVSTYPGEATVAPRVFFRLARDTSGTEYEGTNVRVIGDEPPGFVPAPCPGISTGVTEPKLLVDFPVAFGASANDVGEVLVRVAFDEGGVGFLDTTGAIFDDAPAGRAARQASTADQAIMGEGCPPMPVSVTDTSLPTFLIVQSASGPTLGSDPIRPKGARIDYSARTGAPLLTISGANFIDFPVAQENEEGVRFLGEDGCLLGYGTNVTVVNATTITCDPPAVPTRQLAYVQVRNVDHLANSARQTTFDVMSPTIAEAFGYFDDEDGTEDGQLRLTAVSSDSGVEGTTLNRTISGISPVVAHSSVAGLFLAVVDPRVQLASGAPYVSVGSRIQGVEYDSDQVANTSVSVGSMVTPAGMGTNAEVSFDLVVALPSNPPGAFALGGTSDAFRTNTGTKQLRIAVDHHVNPQQDPASDPDPHVEMLLAQGADLTGEATRAFTYLTAAVPTVAGAAAASGSATAIRDTGGQSMTVSGVGIRTAGGTPAAIGMTALSSVDLTALTSADDLRVRPNLALVYTDAMFPTGIAIPVDGADLETLIQLDATTNELAFVVPDIRAALASAGATPTYPFTLTPQVTNPDGQVSDLGATTVTFTVYQSLAHGVEATITSPTPASPVPTVAGGSPRIYNYAGSSEDFVLPAGETLYASGDAPLIIRARGNIVINGSIELSLDSVGAQTAYGSDLPAAAGAGGAANTGANPNSFGLPGLGSPGINPDSESLLGPMMTITLAEQIEFWAFGGQSSLGGFAAGGGGGGSTGMGTSGGSFGAMIGGAGSIPITSVGGTMMAPVAPFGVADNFGGLPAFTPAETLPLPTPISNWAPLGGSGGGAGGLATDTDLFTATPGAPVTTPVTLAPGGAGGAGGGAIILACDGTITIGSTAIINVNGAAGADGMMAASGMAEDDLFSGGGGGGGGGVIVLQALQGLTIDGSAVLSATGGAAGMGGVAGLNDGGVGSAGAVLISVPTSVAGVTSTIPMVNMISPMETIVPFPSLP